MHWFLSASEKLRN